MWPPAAVMAPAFNRLRLRANQQNRLEILQFQKSIANAKYGRSMVQRCFGTKCSPGTVGGNSSIIVSGGASVIKRLGYNRR